MRSGRAWQKYRYGRRTFRILHFLLHFDWTGGQIARVVGVSRQRVHEVKRIYLPRHAK